MQHEWILESSKIFISVILNISIQTVNGWRGYTIKNGFIVSTILFTLYTFPTVTDTLTFLSFLFSFQGFKNNYNKQGHAILNLNCADNANFILSSLVHVIRSIQQPFPRNLSCQFDNASNNKCNTAFGLFAYLVLEDIYRYSKDKWLPDPEDATTYLSDNDRYGILVFNVRVLLN